MLFRSVNVNLRTDCSMIVRTNDLTLCSCSFDLTESCMDAPRTHLYASILCNFFFRWLLPLVVSIDVMLFNHLCPMKAKNYLLTIDRWRIFTYFLWSSVFSYEVLYSNFIKLLLFFFFFSSCFLTTSITRMTKVYTRMMGILLLSLDLNTHRSFSSS